MLDSLRARESAILFAVQSRASGQRIVVIARIVSAFGEHALGWAALAAAGVLFDSGRALQWALAGGAVLGAHLLSIIVKRIVRRPRPNDPRVQVLASAPSALSFPSSHATSAAASAVVFGFLLGPVALSVLCIALLATCLSRLVLGMHFTTDVLAGVFLGSCVGCVAQVISEILVA